MFAVVLQYKSSIYVGADVLTDQNYLQERPGLPGPHLVRSGLYRYKDGDSWQHHGWPNVRAFALAVDPRNHDRLFLACGNGLLRSIDNGGTWRVTTGWRVTEVLDVAIDPAAPEHIYISTAFGVWRSLDGAETWEGASEGLRPTFSQALAVDRTSAGRVIAGTEAGLFESDDAADHWRPVGPRNLAIRAIVQSAANPELWAAGTEEHGLLISTDGARSWGAASEPLPSQTVYALAADPADPHLLAAGGFESGVLVSTDGGNRWQASGHGLPTSTVHALRFDPAKRGRLWVGTVGHGVYYLDADDESWMYAGLQGAYVWDIVFSK